MKRKMLLDEIREFQSAKKVIISGLVLLGVLGLLLPILPGTAFLLLAFLLVFPKDGERILNRIRKALRRIFKSA